MSLIQNVRATLKSADTEGAFELYVTRTPGYLWALLFKVLHIHPIAVTLISIIIGAAAGVCFAFTSLKWTLIGMLLLIWANWYDCADGQLARMTGKRTLIGRLLDGLAGDIWFFAIYHGLAFRIFFDPLPGSVWMNETLGWPVIVWGWIFIPIGLWAGYHCHAKQCAVADYYRNIHMWVQLGRSRAEFDTFADMQKRYDSLGWKKGEWFEKLYIHFYRYYCKGQEDQTPEFQKFYKAVQQRWNGELPQRLRDEFRQKSLPLMPTTNLLTFDFRVGVLFFTLLIDQPGFYPIVEITLMEYWRWRMRRTHEAFCADFTERLSEYED